MTVTGENPFSLPQQPLTKYSFSARAWPCEFSSIHFGTLSGTLFVQVLLGMLYCSSKDFANNLFMFILALKIYYCWYRNKMLEQLIILFLLFIYSLFKSTDDKEYRYINMIYGKYRSQRKAYPWMSQTNKHTLHLLSAMLGIKWIYRT